MNTDTMTADTISLGGLLREDFETHGRSLSPGFLALAAHRIVRRMPFFGKALSVAADLTFGIKIPEYTYVGRRVHIWHHGSLVLDAQHIGNDVHIRHDTTFGPYSNDEPAGTYFSRPVIGDGVDIASGAVILGPQFIGDGARIGANSVVVEDVPAQATVFGIPARVIK